MTRQSWRRTVGQWWLVGVVVLALPGAAFGWGHTGHMVVTKIAESRLESKVKKRITHLINIRDLTVEGQGSAELVTFRKNRSFVTAACWADDIKSLGDSFNHRHYIDVPFSPDGTTLPAVADDNALVAMRECVRVLESKTAPEGDKATLLRFLLHFVGDVHQPLHCSTRVTKAHPDGDQGGNLFKLAHSVKLHSYWDSGLGLFKDPDRDQDLHRLEPASKAAITRLANGITAVLPPASLPGADNLDFQAWIDESSTLAQSTVYAIAEKSEPSVAYNEKGQDVVRRRVALAGYRLAALLNRTFKKEAAP